MYHCIVNPAAGRSHGRELISVIETFMKDHGNEIEIKETTKVMDAARLAREACAAGSQGIIGIGGDGTIQEIVTGMLDGQDKCGTPLGIISCGSGNDLWRSFGLLSGQKNSVHACLTAVQGGKTLAVDAIRTNDAACLNIANIGLDARIVDNAKRFKKVFGKNAYVVSALISIFSHKNTPLTVSIDDGKEYFEGKFTLVAVCNGQYYGGNMRIAPSAQMDDGKITFLVVSKSSKAVKGLAILPSKTAS